MRAIPPIVTFIIFTLVSVNGIKAKPLFIRFDEMIDRTSCIAIGTFLGYDGKSADQSNFYYFKVDQYLKFSQLKTKSDTLKLTRASGTPYLEPGIKCVAFINETGGFEWYGTTKNLIISDQSVLFIEGFYDFNAYIVSPCMLSVGQLKDYIQDGSYSGSVYGNVHFFSNTTKKMEPSIIKIEVTYTYTRNTSMHHVNTDNSMTYEVMVNGINLNDFKKQPSFDLPWHYREVVIEYEPNLSRPLEIKGKIEEMHPSANRWRCYFWVEEPEELTYDEFVKFINDPKKGYPYYELELKMENDKTYKILLNDEIGRVGKLIGYTSQPIPISSLSTSPKREIVFNNNGSEIILTLDSLLINKDVFEFAGEDLIRELKMGPVSGKIITEWNGSRLDLGSCTVSYKATRFFKY